VPDKFKLKLVSIIVAHPDLTHSEKCVAIFILEHFKTSAKCWMSREHVAAALGLSARQVTRAYASIETARIYHIHRELIGRRKDGSPVYGSIGNANEFNFPVQMVNEACGDGGVDTHVPLSRVSLGKHAKNGAKTHPAEAEKHPSEGKREGHPCPSLVHFPKKTSERGTFEAKERDTHVPPSNYVTGAASAAAPSPSASPYGPSGADGLAAQEEEFCVDEGPIQTGERVFHQKFGNGNVTAIDGNKLTIAFDKAGEKRVVDSFVERV
jgi:hypothetical protein